MNKGVINLYLWPRVRERYPGTEIERYASFIGESLKKTKTREFVPSQEEIAALLVRQEMSTTVYCHGGGSCKISINSHTTAGEVNVNTHTYIDIILFMRKHGYGYILLRLC